MHRTSWWGPTLTELHGFAERVRAWPVTSQQQARRNAMVASTACAQRRAEREDVADFLAQRDGADPSADLQPLAAPSPETAPVESPGQPRDGVRRAQHG